MTSRFSSYAVVAAVVVLAVTGLILTALAAGWWGLRRALHRGRACPVCGLWGTELDTIIHECLEHEREQDP